MLVVHDGAVVEDGTPEGLLAEDTSYRALVEGDRHALAGVWGKPEWKRLRVVDGQIVEKSAVVEATS